MRNKPKLLFANKTGYEGIYYKSQYYFKKGKKKHINTCFEKDLRKYVKYYKKVNSGQNGVL